MAHSTFRRSHGRRSLTAPGLVGLLAAATLGLATANAAPETSQRTFDSPEQAAAALVDAAERFDVEALTEILGPDGVDLVVTADPVYDRNLAAAFAAEARRRTTIERVAGSKKLALLSVSDDDWPLAIPIVKQKGKWRFDVEAGREELLHRRIGRNELDAIEICRGYVEAQREYALVKRDGSRVNQYAQRLLSTPGKQDGLAWQAADGSWQGPVGEAIARVISEGYEAKPSPYNGYYFKVLKGQGPHAPLGEMDFVVDGAMIGGFALAAAPTDHSVTGVMSFIVSHDGVVFQRDLGPDTLEAFRAMERYDPDPGWTPVDEP
jgi:hypothetical protein